MVLTSPSLRDSIRITGEARSSTTERPTPPERSPPTPPGGGMSGPLAGCSSPSMRTSRGPPSSSFRSSKRERRSLQPEQWVVSSGSKSRTTTMSTKSHCCLTLSTALSGTNHLSCRYIYLDMLAIQSDFYACIIRNLSPQLSIYLFRYFSYPIWFLCLFPIVFYITVTYRLLYLSVPIISNIHHLS